MEITKLLFIQSISRTKRILSIENYQKGKKPVILIFVNLFKK